MYSNFFVLQCKLYGHFSNFPDFFLKPKMFFQSISFYDRLSFQAISKTIDFREKKLQAYVLG